MAEGASLDLESSLSDVTTKYHRENGRLVVQRTQDVEGYLEANKAEYNASGDYRRYSGGRKDKAMHKVASIPMIVVEQWMREGVNILDPSPEMQKKVAQKLNSNEWRHLRTKPGRVGYRA